LVTASRESTPCPVLSLMIAIIEHFIDPIIDQFLD
jgi:hypothetical protein